MKDNREIFNEAFFKKMNYQDKIAKKMPQYAPVDAKAASTGNNLMQNMPAYQVTSTDEVKKRLAGTFGATFGNNSIKSMAGRAIKSFPIIVSDNVEPETIVMLKRLMEEQYAEYINLLISNQVIDLGDFRSNGEDGNIAIQALDTISGTEFGQAAIADKANRTGKLSADNIFGNVALYNLLRENREALVTGDAITDTLLENACIVTPDEVENMVNYLKENADDIAALSEATATISANGPRYRVDDDDDRYKADMDNGYRGNRLPSNDSTKNMKLSQYMMQFDNSDDNIRTSNRVLNRMINQDAVRGFQGVDDKGNEIYSQLTTADIVIDSTAMDRAINRSVGAILSDPRNVEIRDKFEKATFLLQSRRIAGIEYYNYLVLRLGIPVSDKSRKELVSRFKIGDVIDYGRGSKSGGKTSDDISFNLKRSDVSNIANNRRMVEPIVNDICNRTLKEALIAMGAIGGGAGLGALIGYGFTGTTSTGGGSAAGGASGGAVTPIVAASGIGAGAIWIGAIAGAAVGAGSYGLYRLIRNRIKAKHQKDSSRKIEGWERVEALIEAMEKYQAEIRKTPYETVAANQTVSRTADIIKNANAHLDNSKDKLSKAANDIDTGLTAQEFNDLYNNSSKMVMRSLTEKTNEILGVMTYNSLYEAITSENYLYNLNEDVKNLSEELANDKEYQAAVLSEKVLLTTPEPMKTKYIAPKGNMDVLLTPTNYSRSDYAYGSIEFDRRDMKDRKYNQPLIMTIKFKERFSDGKYSDNELVAVIGILGKVVRVPSNEMEYILKASAEGTSVENLLKGSADLQNTITDLLSGSKINKDVKNLQQSADVWRNLEKVATLAAANKLSGKRNNAVANAHIIFSQKEIDNVRNDVGIDYLKDSKKAASLMKKYSAFTLMVANDPGQRLYIFDDVENISWNVVPYGALTGKDTGDQLNALVNKLGRL